MEATEKGIKLEPSDIVINKRHTKIIGTFTKKNNPEMITK